MVERMTDSEIIDASTTELAYKMAELGDRKKGLKEQIDEIDAELDQVKSTLRDKMIEIGMPNFKIAGIGTYYIKNSMYPKVLDLDKTIEWLDNNGYASVAPRKIHIPALREMVEQRLEGDLMPPPEDLILCHPEASVVLRASKKEN